MMSQGAPNRPEWRLEYTGTACLCQSDKDAGIGSEHARLSPQSYEDTVRCEWLKICRCSVIDSLSRRLRRGSFLLYLNGQAK